MEEKKGQSLVAYPLWPGSLENQIIELPLPPSRLAMEDYQVSNRIVMFRLEINIYLLIKKKSRTSNYIFVH